MKTGGTPGKGSVASWSIISFCVKPVLTRTTRRETRIRLLKIGEVRAIKCGKRIEVGHDWDFFFSADYESMDKMSLGHDDPVYERFLAEVIQPHVAEQLTLSYEIEPGKDVRYS